MDLKLEVVGVPVSDVDRADAFYKCPEWPDWHAEYMVRERAGEELPA